MTINLSEYKHDSDREAHKMAGLLTKPEGVTLKPVTAGISPRIAWDSLARMLSESQLLTMATVDDQGNPWVNCAFYVHDEQFNLYFFTKVNARHSRNLATTGGRAAISITDTSQRQENVKSSIQMEGQCSPIGLMKSIAVLKRYSSLFPDRTDIRTTLDAFRGASLSMRTYMFIPTFIRIFDESTFGKRIWVDCAVEPPTSGG